MTAEPLLSRRVFLARAAGLTLTLGAPRLLRSRVAGTRPPYTGGIWLAGDHHIHTRFSPDGQYEIVQQVANAARHGLDWCVITDHGGPAHDKIALEQAYPDLVAARRTHPQTLVFQGLEWNIPAGEHASVILPPTADESHRIATFEALYDERNLSRVNTPANTEADAVAALKYLQSLAPRPLFIANHPARRGLDSPHEMRAWADAGPDVVRGFEGAPGHQAGTLSGKVRGEYDRKPGGEGAWAAFPEEAYRTWGGYDWFVAKVGGLWDSLLGEGRAWYITANSDSHRHYTDRTVVDESTYRTRGFVTPTTGQTERRENVDFFPGEYSKTWVYAARRDHTAVLEALRRGNSFTVLGGLVDRLALTAQNMNRAASMGSILALERAGEDVTVTFRLRVPEKANFAGARPTLHHVDLIAGDILGPAADRDAMTNPTTRVVAQLRPAEARREGMYRVFTHRFDKVRRSFYVRLRGTNRDLDAPRLDTPTGNPWEDLWFYSNPVMVHVP